MQTKIESMSVPPGFGQIPLDRNDSERLRAAQHIAEFAPTGTAQVDVEGMAYHVSSTGALLSSYGAILAGVLTLPEATDTGFLMLSQHQLTLTGPPLPDIESRGEYARALKEELSNKEPLAQVQILDLNCGPTVTIRRDAEYRFPPHVSASGVESVLPVRSWQALVPTPDGKALAVLDVGCGETDNWDYFVELAIGSIGTIRFSTEVAEQ